MSVRHAVQGHRSKSRSLCVAFSVGAGCEVELNAKDKAKGVDPQGAWLWKVLRLHQEMTPRTRR